MGNPGSGTIDARKYWPWAVVAAVILIGSASAPVIFSGNAAALGIFGVLLTFITTLFSVLATKYYAEMDHQNTLTRYGLQAWRNLDSLAIKVEKEIARNEANCHQLEEWLLDIDRAKLGWRDLLQAVFALQERLERESSEISLRYQEQLNHAETPEEKLKLEKERDSVLAEKSSMAPLPLKISETVKCPNCEHEKKVLLGRNQGETTWLLCPECTIKYAVHRNIDGSIKIGGLFNKKKQQQKICCPNCADETSLNLSKSAGIIQCFECNTHILYSGNSENLKLEDLGIVNAHLTCPHCTKSQEIWINPTREVGFLTSCKECGLPLQISGNKDNFSVTEVAQNQ